jgi:hypothetical protein
MGFLIWLHKVLPKQFYSFYITKKTQYLATRLRRSYRVSKTICSGKVRIAHPRITKISSSGKVGIVYPRITKIRCAIRTLQLLKFPITRRISFNTEVL